MNRPIPRPNLPPLIVHRRMPPVDPERMAPRMDDAHDREVYAMFLINLGQYITLNNIDANINNNNFVELIDYYRFANLDLLQIALNQDLNLNVHNHNVIQTLINRIMDLRNNQFGGQRRKRYSKFSGSKHYRM